MFTTYFFIVHCPPVFARKRNDGHFRTVKLSTRGNLSHHHPLALPLSLFYFGGKETLLAAKGWQRSQGDLGVKGLIVLCFDLFVCVQWSFSCRFSHVNLWKCVSFIYFSLLVNVHTYIQNCTVQNCIYSVGLWIVNPSELKLSPIDSWDENTKSKKLQTSLSFMNAIEVFGMMENRSRRMILLES